MKRQVLACVVTIALLGACSGIKPYANSYDKNVRISTDTDSSFFARVRTAVDIYRVEGVCETIYQGTVQLGEANTLLGLPSERTAYLVFVFEGSSFLANSRSSVTYETVFRPEPDNRYEFEVSYADKIYGVQMRKASVGGNDWTDVHSQPLAGC